MKAIANLALVLLLTGCVSVAPGSDPFVVHSERTINYAFETVNAFMEYHHKNRSLLADPEITEAARKLSEEFPVALADAKRLLRTYKASRAVGDRDAAEAAVQLLNQAILIANRYLPARP